MFLIGLKKDCFDRRTADRNSISSEANKNRKRNIKLWNYRRFVWLQCSNLSNQVLFILVVAQIKSLKEPLFEAKRKQNCLAAMFHLSDQILFVRGSAKLLLQCSNLSDQVLFILVVLYSANQKRNESKIVWLQCSTYIRPSSFHSRGSAKNKNKK